MNSFVASTYLSLDQYQELAKYTDQLSDGDDQVSQLRYGFFGEVGGLLSAVKKFHREKSLSRSRRESAEEELGDALWYLATMVRRAGLPFSSIGDEAILHLQKRMGFDNAERAGGGTCQFTEIDGLIAFQRQQMPDNFTALLYELATRTGQLFAKIQSPCGQFELGEVQLFGQLLALLALVAATFQLSLASVAASNIAKIESRWRTQEAEYPSLFDDALDEYEQLPREIEMDFCERRVGDRFMVVQRWRQVNVGDPISDNRTELDYYRYHDVFHLAYVAHLGWSPVIRGLLKLKRKSLPEVDENEDGARAMIIEEAIATWIFNYARDKGEFFEDVVIGKLEYGLLKQIKSMVAGYEVEKCPLWQWECAILEGFAVFRKLRDNHGGRVIVSMANRTLSYVPPEKCL